MAMRERKPASDKVEFPFRRRDAVLAFLLEEVEGIDQLFSDVVHSSKRADSIMSHDFDDVPEIAMHRLRIASLAATFCGKQCRANLAPWSIRHTFEVLLGAADPTDRFHPSSSMIVVRLSVVNSGPTWLT
ncbi:MAG TPA: hypothetical protein VMF11_04935 [Candidatus Baltobacteraceae bacterium]|nr:hypothetical protein [Candidatus Baltobacteraceae bacterium]